jgi:CRP-like cAMP-binding protein
MPHHPNNRILSTVSAEDMADLQPHLRLVELEHGRVLAESRQRGHKVYFPHGGILSSVVELKTGWGIEVGMIGKDGVFGAAQAMDDRMSLNKIVVQVPGWASVIDAPVVKELAGSSPEFRGLLVQYDQFLSAQVQQTAACNALHTVEQRMCTWLVRMHDLVGTELPLTQEFLAQMMGVRRTSVTAVAVQMQSEGLITYRRGHIRIVNMELIQKRGCECHESIREYAADIFADAAEPIPFHPAPDMGQISAGG